MDKRRSDSRRGFYDRERDRDHESDRDRRVEGSRKGDYDDRSYRYADRDERSNRYVDKDREQSRRDNNRYEDRDRHIKTSRFSRSKSPERRQVKSNESKRGEKLDEKKDKEVKVSEAVEQVNEETYETEEDAQLAAFLGITGFSSTKGLQVKGNEFAGAADTGAKKRREYRQYLFVKGAYDIPLTKDQLEASKEKDQNN